MKSKIRTAEAVRASAMRPRAWQESRTPVWPNVALLPFSTFLSVSLIPFPFSFPHSSLSREKGEGKGREREKKKIIIGGIPGIAEEIGRAVFPSRNEEKLMFLYVGNSSDCRRRNAIKSTGDSWQRILPDFIVRSLYGLDYQPQKSLFYSLARQGKILEGSELLVILLV